MIAECLPTGATVMDLIFAVWNLTAPILEFLWALFLALYTGLVASRIFAFFQMRYKAVQWIFDLQELMTSAHLSPQAFSIALGRRTQPIIVEFRALGHIEASYMIADIFQRHLHQLATLCGVAIPDNKMPDLPGDIMTSQNAETQSRWVENMWAVRNLYASNLADDANRLASVEFSRWAIVTPNPFPKYLSFGQGVGLFRPKTKS